MVDDLETVAEVLGTRPWSAVRLQVVHEGGWRLVLHDDRSLDHHRPDGVRWRASQPDRLADRVTGRPGLLSGSTGQTTTEQTRNQGDADPLAA